MPSNIYIANNLSPNNINISITQVGDQILPEGPDGVWNQIASSVPNGGQWGNAYEVAWIDRNQGITNGDTFFWNITVPDQNGAPLATCAVKLVGTLTSSDIAIKAMAANGSFDGDWVATYTDSPKYKVTQNNVTYYVGYFLEPNSLGYSNPTFWAATSPPTTEQLAAMRKAINQKASKASTKS
jgi:hypothetical protein